MCAGRSPPPEIVGKARKKTKWDKLSPITKGVAGARRAGGKKRPMTGFGVRRAPTRSASSADLPPLKNGKIDRYAINDHGLTSNASADAIRARKGLPPRSSPNRRPVTAPQLDR